MLRITRSEGNDLTHTLKLQGKLLGPWSDLTFVDAAGARFLEVLIRDGARVVACSVFVEELLHLE